MIVVMRRALLVLLLLTAIAHGRGAFTDEAVVVQARALLIENGAGQTSIVQPILDRAPTESEVAWVVLAPGPVEARWCGYNTFGSLAWATAPDEVEAGPATVVLGLWALALSVALVRRVQAKVRTVGCLVVGLAVVATIAIPNLIEARDGPVKPRVPHLTLLDARRLEPVDLEVVAPRAAVSWIASRHLTLDPSTIAALEAAPDGHRAVVCRLAPEPGRPPAPLALPPPLRLDHARAPGGVTLPDLLARDVALDVSTIGATRYARDDLDVHRALPTGDGRGDFRLSYYATRPSLEGIAWPASGWITRARGVVGPGPLTLAVDGSTRRAGRPVYDAMAVVPVVLAVVLALATLLAAWTSRERRERWLLTALALAWPIFAWDLLRAVALGETVGETHPPSQWAIGKLRGLNTSQTLFREGDKEGDGTLDYGTLVELSQTTLIDSVLGSGTYIGYRFECAPHRLTPEFLWSASATPMQPGGLALAIDHTGVLRYTVVLEVDGRGDADDEGPAR
jgi:hypothetical protein